MEQITEKIRTAFLLRPGEGQLVGWSFIYFFSLLAAYFILRPVRENMGIVGGIDNLPWLFTGTFAAMLVLAPVYAGLASKFPKRIFLPVVYGFFIINILGFRWLFSFEDLIVHTAQGFFIWISVFNLFVVSVFWSFMVNIFSKAQGKRLFGLIGAGGTLGTVVGSGITAWVSGVVATENLLLISAIFLSGALLAIFKLLPLARNQKLGTPFKEFVGGGFYSGFKDTLTQPYLLGISLFIALFSLTSTVLYFQQAEIVSNLFETSGERTQVFAGINLAVSVLTLLTQFFVTSRFIKNFGVTAALLFLPVVTFFGFVLFSTQPVLAVLVLFQVIRRTANFAITRPGREMLFSIVSEDQKYKAKNVIDTMVYRGSDAFSGWFYAALNTGFGLGISAIAAFAAPIALVWAGLAWWLGRKYSKPGSLKTAEEKA